MFACFVLFDVTCPGPATLTNPALSHCFCLVADVNISFERFDGFFYFAYVAQVII